MVYGRGGGVGFGPPKPTALSTAVCGSSARKVTRTTPTEKKQLRARQRFGKCEVWYFIFKQFVSNDKSLPTEITVPSELRGESPQRSIVNFQVLLLGSKIVEIFMTVDLRPFQRCVKTISVDFNWIDVILPTSVRSLLYLYLSVSRLPLLSCVQH